MEYELDRATNRADRDGKTLRAALQAEREKCARLQRALGAVPGGAGAKAPGTAATLVQPLGDKENMARPT